MKKDKYLQIFNYLKEFSKLRSNPVRDIEAQETQYPEKFWLDDIPENELFENIIRSDFNEDNDYWLKVRKPKEPTKPEFSKLTENLEKQQKFKMPLLGEVSRSSRDSFEPESGSNKSWDDQFNSFKSGKH